MPPSPAKLISKANAAAIRFLNTELDTGLSFIRMAARVRTRKKARPGDAAKVKRYLAHARKAHDAVASRQEHIREILEEVQSQIVISRELRETSSNLRQQNAELREMLLENMLTCLSKREHWGDR